MDFSHFDEKGKALMVDVTEKKETERCFGGWGCPS